MKLEDLYTSIEKKKINTSLIIFKNTESSFIATQYIKEIAKIKGLNITYIENIEILTNTNMLLDEVVAHNLYVYRVDKLDLSNKGISKELNVCIICNTIEKQTEQLYSKNIVTVQKLEKWQIENYILGQLQGITNEDAVQLANACAYNIFSVQMQIDKLKLFSSQEQKIYFQNFYTEGLFFSTSKFFNIFDFISAIMKRDVQEVVKLYNLYKLSDTQIFGLLALLHNNFKNLINVQLDSKSTPASCSLSATQYTAIKHCTNIFNRAELLKILELITSIDVKIKTGALTEAQAEDYLLVNIFS